ncbi:MULTISPECIES: flagellar protein FlaG [unclassified Virgibacillus]|uniref:flagellar protein FlaG n=1 Tax=unclassified Virgibacillus TaxID=2620237 RepID=UPI0024DE3637|nr:flagellar protein FlaG [Virgibacillus sp. LDC-1]
MRLENLVTNSLSNEGIKYSEPIRTVSQGLREKDNVLQENHVANQEEVEMVVSKLNEFVQPLRTDLKFQLHEKLNEYYVEVVDPITKEVVKEIPPKKFLDMYAAMAEYMGILIDEKI